MAYGGVSAGSGVRPTPPDLVVGSADPTGALISITATSSPGTLLHTVPPNVKDFQRIVVWAANGGSAEEQLTLQFGTTAAKDRVPIKLGPERGFIEIVPGLKLYRGQSVRAFSPTPGTVSCYVGVADRDKSP